jgi:bifunctional non-homologous end joining protein LigD
MMVRRDPSGVRLLTRNGNNWTDRYPLIAEAAGALTVRSFLLDGEAVAVDRDGMPSFDRLRYRRADGVVFLFAFDLLELDGRDLRREPVEVRKATLASMLRKARPGVQLNEHLEHPEGDVVFRHACKLGLEGIVSKRLGARSSRRLLASTAGGICLNTGNMLQLRSLPPPRRSISPTSTASCDSPCSIQHSSRRFSMGGIHLDCSFGPC